MSSENSWENSQSKDVGVLETHVQAVDTSDADPSAEVSRERQSLSDFLTIVSFILWLQIYLDSISAWKMLLIMFLAC